MLTLTRLTPRKKCHVMKNNYFILITSLPSQSIDIHFGKYSTLVFENILYIHVHVGGFFEERRGDLQPGLAGTGPAPHRG